MIALGNHDIYNIQHRGIHIHPLYRSMILRHHKHVYYDEYWNGIHIYVLNPQLATKQHGILFQDQLTWLRQKLKQDDPTKPILLFCHHPLSDLYVNSDSQKQKEELKMILHKYPNICYFSGHLHNDAALCERRIGSLLANCAIKMSTKANNKEIKPKINVKRMNSNGNKNK